jgi:methyl-accepting chemotaxis protein
MSKTGKAKIRNSLSRELILLFLAGVVIMAAVVSAVFILSLRDVSFSEAEKFLRESSSHLGDQVQANLRERSQLLDYTGMGTAPYIEAATPGAPGGLGGSGVNETELIAYFQTMMKTLDEVQLLYCCSPFTWTQPGGFMIFGDGWKPDDPAYDNMTRAWCGDAVKAAGKTVFTDPYVDMITNKLVVSITRLIHDGQNRPLAVMGEDISMAKLNDMANAVTALPGMKSFILHPSGKYITNPDGALIMEKDFFEDQGLEAFRTDVLGKDQFIGQNGEMVVCSLRLPLTGWSLVSIVPQSEVYANSNRAILFASIIAAAALVLLGLFVSLIIRHRLKPLKVISNELQGIAEGEGDLTRRINVDSKNEIGSLGQYFNETMEKIQALVRTIKHTALSLDDTSSQLTQDMTQTASSMDEITTSIQEIRQRVINQSASVNESSATMEQINQNIQKLSSAVDAQDTSVAQSSSAIEEMLANIDSVTNTLVKNAENVKSLSAASDVGHTGLQDVAGSIQEISKESEGLLEINAVMENIASQTNLLSMNAAIEAAHAGEAGKGFAVVADEIRKLAENSNEQSHTISTVLKKIKSSIDSITKATDSVLLQFEAITGSVKTVAEQEGNIRNAMEEQSAGSKQVLEAIGKLNELTQQVKAGTKQMLDGSNQVITESRNLEEATEGISSGMNEMANNADQVNKSVMSVNEITDKNKEQIGTLMTEVSKFKVE